MTATYIVPLTGIALMVAGVLGVGVAAWRSHKVSARLDFIRSLGSEAELYAEAVPVVERVHEPLVNRMFGPIARTFRNSLSRLYPSSEVDRVHADLLKAGLTGTVRAEEFVAVQAGTVMLGIAVGLIGLVSGVVSVKMGLALLFILPDDRGIGARATGCGTASRSVVIVSRTICPTLLDLMCISVAAGLGLEQAMQVSCARFESPVCDELRLTLARDGARTVTA